MGLKQVFPESELYVVDILPQVIKSLNKNFNIKGVVSTPENLPTDELGSFDLVVAYDLLEHLQNPKKAIDKISEVLNPSGVIFAITPNGYEDVWGHHLLFKFKKEPAKIGINHVYYFDPNSLIKYILNLGFSDLNCHLSHFKGFKNGIGWKVDNSLIVNGSDNFHSEIDESNTLPSYSLDLSNHISQRLIGRSIYQNYVRLKATGIRRYNWRKPYGLNTCIFCSKN